MVSRRVADLASVDGCVIFDRELRVHGFAARIASRTNDHALTLRNAKTGDAIGAEKLRGLGTRHRSAIDLCRSVPNAIAFVVSQDGELRVFCSDETGAYGFEGLSPGHFSDAPVV